MGCFFGDKYEKNEFDNGKLASSYYRTNYLKRTISSDDEVPRGPRRVLEDVASPPAPEGPQGRGPCIAQRTVRERRRSEREREPPQDG